MSDTVPATRRTKAGAAAVSHALQRALLAAPLVPAGLLLWRLPRIVAEPWAGTAPLQWRLDALTLVFLVALCLAVALPALLGRAQHALAWVDIGRALAALGVIAAGAGAERLLVLPAALLVAALLLQSWRWGAASATLGVAVLVLRYGGASTWSAPETAAALGSAPFLLLLAAVCTGLGCYPAALAAERADVPRLQLQAIWLLPLIRTFGLGPWNTGWAAAVVLLGAATTIWASGAALNSASDTERTVCLTRAWLGMALLSAGLASPVGTAAALLLVIGYGVNVALLQPAAAERSRWALWAAPFPPAVGFVAAWLAQGAAAAAGSFVLAALLWLALLLQGLAVLRLRITDTPPRSVGAAALAILSMLLGVLSPLVLRLLVMPAVELLQGGLTPFGLLDIWPWVGVAALDAGQRRVAVLPSIAIALLAFVVAALVWLLARLFGWTRAADEADAAPALRWDELRERVWWLRGRRRG